MARSDSLQTWKPSVVDRLSDPTTAGAVGREGYGLRQMEEAVRRDLEDLLNTRQTHQGMSDAFPELLNSVAAYGLPDFAALDPTRSSSLQVGTLVARIHILECLDDFYTSIRLNLAQIHRQRRMTFLAHLDGAAWTADRNVGESLDYIFGFRRFRLLDRGLVRVNAFVFGD